jgi:ribosomal 30S subunit maturation factor RimM
MERLCTAGIRHLKMPNKRAPRKIVLLQGKHRHNDEYLVQLENIESRESAQNLRGAWLYVRQEQDETSTSLSQAKEEYMISDLVGLEVFLIHEEDDSNEMGKHQFVGRVGGVVLAEDICSIPGLGHDYLEVVLPRGIGGTFSLRDELVLIPFVPPIVPRVDLEQRACWIDPPNGLLDLTYVREEKTRIRGFLPTASERM